jgi:hypothetical protein
VQTCLPKPLLSWIKDCAVHKRSKGSKVYQGTCKTAKEQDIRKATKEQVERSRHAKRGCPTKERKSYGTKTGGKKKTSTSARELESIMVS